MVSDTSTSDTAVSNPTSSDSTDSDSTDSDSTGSDSTDSTSTSDGAVSNVLLVTIDSLRADAIGPYDNDRYSPVLSDLAADGTVFDRSFATGNWTPFSFPSILASEPVFARNGDIGVTSAP